jgi:predicted transcriptional regulator
MTIITNTFENQFIIGLKYIIQCPFCCHEQIYSPNKIINRRHAYCKYSGCKKHFDITTPIKNTTKLSKLDSELINLFFNKKNQAYTQLELIQRFHKERSQISKALKRLINYNLIIKQDLNQNQISSSKKINKFTYIRKMSDEWDYYISILSVNKKVK